MLRWGPENCFYFFFFYFIDKDMLRFLSCDKCSYCKSLWTKASAKCPECKCKCKCFNFCRGCLHIFQKSSLLSHSSHWHCRNNVRTCPYNRWSNLATQGRFGRRVERLGLVKQRPPAQMCVFGWIFQFPVCCQCAFPVEQRRSSAQREKEQRHAPTTQLRFLSEKKPQQPVT